MAAILSKGDELTCGKPIANIHLVSNPHNTALGKQENTFAFSIISRNWDGMGG